jgi:thymidylate synthase (FAD)
VGSRDGRGLYQCGHHILVRASARLAPNSTITVETVQESCRHAYAAYQEMLEAGVAREVARTVLPLSLYSTMYATCNGRALMNFLSLRTRREDSTFPSFPQREIEMVAEKMEAEWAKVMPITHAAFEANGRVAP